MSAIIVVCVEGVLCPVGEELPTASPLLANINLIKKLSESWQVGFVAAAPRETIVEWLKSVGAPTWCWVVEATRYERAEVILRQLSLRQDRAQFVVAGDASQFDTLAENGITTMLVAHSASFALGDWRQPSSWDDSEPVDNEE